MHLPLLPGGGFVAATDLSADVRRRPQTPSNLQNKGAAFRPAPPRHGGGRSAGACLCFGMLVSLITTVLCLVWPPGQEYGFGDSVRVEADALCFRASRENSYAVVELAMGAPMHILRLLVLFDEVVDGEPAFRVFSSRVAESQTLSCGTGQVCQDTVIVQRGASNANEKVRLSFVYASLLDEELAPASHAYELGLDGDVRLSSGMTHLLLRASFCVQARTDWISSLYSMPVLGAPTLSMSQAQELIPKGPLTACAATDERVLMLPSGSVREAWWLALTSMRILQTDASKDRRRVVEAGATCGAANYSDNRAVFLLDCSAEPPFHTRPCDGGPSIPFRRVAHRILRIDALNTTALAYGVEEDPTLHDPDANSNVEFGLSILKLALLVLTAAVVFTRSRRETSSNALIFVDAFVVSRDGEPLIEGTAAFRDVMEDGILGGLTILGRVVVVCWKGPGLIADGHLRIVLVQSFAAAVALAHFVLRYVIEYHNRRERSPLARFGGSTAIVDATSAVILSFADVPLLSSSYESFGGSARLLTAMLLASVALQRCAFAISACGLRAGSERHWDRAMPLVCIGAWTVQSISIGALLTDIFAHPAGYHLGRARSGPTTGYAAAAAAAVLAASGTALTRTTLSVFDELDRVRGKQRLD
jgi:hypothetical protein